MWASVNCFHMWCICCHAACFCIYIFLLPSFILIFKAQQNEQQYANTMTTRHCYKASTRSSFAWHAAFTLPRYSAIALDKSGSAKIKQAHIVKIHTHTDIFHFAFFYRLCAGELARSEWYNAYENLMKITWFCVVQQLTILNVMLVIFFLLSILYYYHFLSPPIRYDCSGRGTFSVARNGHSTRRACVIRTSFN